MKCNQLSIGHVKDIECGKPATHFLFADTNCPICDDCIAEYRSEPRDWTDEELNLKTIPTQESEWDGDKPLPEDDAIKAAHPMLTGRHDLYAEAMRLVGAKHSKGALVGLVNWLLVEGVDATSRLQLHRDARKTLADAYIKALADLDEARSVARTAIAAVKAYSEELNGKPTGHTFDAIVAKWPAVPYREPTTSEAAAVTPVAAGRALAAMSDAHVAAVASGAADEPTPLQRATAAVLDEAGMTLADEPTRAICGAPTTYIPGEWCELPEGHDGAHGRGSRVPAADEPREVACDHCQTVHPAAWECGRAADEPKGERPAVAYVPATRWSSR